MDTAQRNDLAALMDWSHEHAAQIHYPPIVNGQIIRQQTVHDLTSIERYKARVLEPGGAIWDCSQNVYALLLAVGARVKWPDGSTATLLNEGPHYRDGRAAYIGAVVVYGPGTGHHATMTRHRDVVHGNPVQYSQGSEPDPRYINLLSEAAGQPAPFTFVSVAHL